MNLTIHVRAHPRVIKSKPNVLANDIHTQMRVELAVKEWADEFQCPELQQIARDDRKTALRLVETY